MKLLISLLFLAACTGPTSKDRAKARVRSTNTECITETGKQSDLTFCVEDDVLLICNNDECLVYAPH